MTHHRRGLRRLLKDDALLGEIEADWKTAAIDAKRLAMLTYAEKLTLTPQSMQLSDVEDLRAVGFSDRDILDICEVVSYYAYVNRIADGLGVPMESWVTEE